MLMTMPLSTSKVNNLVDRAAFEDLYEAKAPWDIGKPQGPLAAVADRTRVGMPKSSRPCQ
jgi:hypothetical protein